MKQNILTSKSSFKLHYKNKAMEKSPHNKQLTCSIPQILTLAIQLLYLKITLEHIYWHQTREMQHFLHTKVSSQILLHTGKGTLELKRSKQNLYRFCTIGTCSGCNEVFGAIADWLPLIKCPACINLCITVIMLHCKYMQLGILLDFLCLRNLLTHYTLLMTDEHDISSFQSTPDSQKIYFILPLLIHWDRTALRVVFLIYDCKYFPLCLWNCALCLAHYQIPPLTSKQCAILNIVLGITFLAKLLLPSLLCSQIIINVPG